VGVGRKFKDGNAKVPWPAITRGIFKLLMGGERSYLGPKQLICPSSKDLKHRRAGTDVSYTDSAGAECPWYDFRGDRVENAEGKSTTVAGEMIDFSYSFYANIRYTLSNVAYGLLLNNVRDPGLPIAADRNPYANNVPAATRNIKPSTANPEDMQGAYEYKEGQGLLGFSPPLAAAALPGFGPAYFSSAYLLKGGRANSRNHKQAGQSVGYLDGHARWANSPKAGVDDDCIWSKWQEDTAKPGYPKGDTVTGFPLDQVPPSTGYLTYGSMRPRPGWLTDAVLLP